MLAFFTALLAAAVQPSVLEASTPWWEKITVTVDDKGAQQSCRYQSSRAPDRPEACEEGMASTVPLVGGKSGTGLYSRLTFERRFSPGAKLDSGRLQAGDTLIGQRVMHLTIGADGAIDACRVVGTSGDLVPAYSCDGVQAEQFRVAASASAGAQRQAFMSILVYGHQEQIA